MRSFTRLHGRLHPQLTPLSHSAVKELVAPREAFRFATTHVLGGCGAGADRPPRAPVPHVAAMAALLSPPPFKLNEAQKGCLADVEAGVALSLTCGPPGTGKTTTIAAVAWSLATRARSLVPLVLICTQQNVAALNVLQALRRIGFEEVKLVISEGYYHEWHEAEYDAALEPFMHVTGKNKKLPRVAGERLITLLTFGLACSPVLEEVIDAARVGAVMVDEASQAWSGLSLVLDRFFPNLRRLHLFGDDRQLPPVLSPADKSPLALLCDRHVRSMYDEVRDAGAPLHSLLVQHRMPLRLAAFISHHVYQGRLSSAAGMDGRGDAVCWVDVSSSQGYLPGAKSPQNGAEASVVCRLVAQIEGRAGLKAATCVILTPFSAQRALIEKMCEHASAKQKGGRWDVKTVDSFQGREADIVILSLVRTDGKVGFLRDIRRANVMLSRSKSRLFIVGDRASWARTKSPLWTSCADHFPVGWRKGDGQDLSVLLR